jgi:hypothetical protein
MEKEKFKGVGVNPELSVILTITVILVLGGIAVILLGIGQEFNFYSSKIVVNGNNINEELHFLPNKPYHTLYRNFASPVFSKNSVNVQSKNYLKFNDVKCSAGNAYLRDYTGQCYESNQETVSCYSYTENNEYGCTFGETLGFSKGKEYIINSEYEIHPENLFKINGDYYIKFVVYSPKNHIKLTRDNLIVEGEVIRDEKYFPEQNVILYIPYTGEISNFNVINQADFQFDSKFKSILKGIFFLFFSLFPAIFFFFIWFFLGREISYENTPKELSTFPSNRRCWEVAAYFNPPFSKVDKNLFASVLLNLYNKKIIDIMEKDGDIYVKLNKIEGDVIERQIYYILQEGERRLKERIFKKNTFYEGYFNLKKAMEDNSLAGDFLSLKDDIKNEGKKYLKDDFSGSILFCTLVLCVPFAIIVFNSTPMLILYCFSLFLVLLFSGGVIFNKFNGEYYIEYQRWKAFKRYLKNSFSIKTATHKTVVIWNEYLIYATALGVPEKVIKELRAYNLIDQNQVNVYNGVILTSSFAFSPGAGGSSFSGGGGFGGAGGGGVGGGGGGGR